MDPFVKPIEAYTRNFDLYETYVNDAATYLSKVEHISLEEAKAFVLKTTSPDGQMPITPPRAKFLVRNSNGDRERKIAPLDGLLKAIMADRQILAPNLVSYVHPDTCKSILADFIMVNLEKRNKAKQAQFAAERAGDKRLMSIMNSAQTTFKIKNNALSGAHSSYYTILWNKSSHSTLTSGCRTATSYGNANNEKFLYGNRHYWSPTITLNNFISIINHSDLTKIAEVMEIFQLQYPSVDQVMMMVKRSTEHYWRGQEHLAKIKELVETFSDVERAAVLFTGDLYHMSVVNPDFIRNMILEFATKSETVLSEEEIKDCAGNIDKDMIAYISMICANELHNPETGLFESFKEVERPDAKGILYGNGRRVYQALQKYALFIQTFWTTDNVPASIYYLPNIIRRGVITSDTDSTIFSVSHWPKWCLGYKKKDSLALAIAATMVYFSSKTIIHILGRFSANSGMAKQDIFRLQMKNEFFFPVFALTTRAKHYYAYISMQEGTMKRELETEIKGVALRSSSVPPEIMVKAKKFMQAIMNKVYAGEDISLRSALRLVANIEQGIKEDIINGNYKWLKRMNINQRDSYKLPEQSNYIHYEFWNDVFGSKYGPAPFPPYRAIKVSIDTDRKSKLDEWIASIEDRAVAQNLQDWIAAKGKSGITTLILPEANLQVYGIPKEIVPRIDFRNLISQTMEAFYLVLETLGFYIKDRHISRLLSDNEWLLSKDNPIEPMSLD